MLVSNSLVLDFSQKQPTRESVVGSLRSAPKRDQLPLVTSKSAVFSCCHFPRNLYHTTDQEAQIGWWVIGINLCATSKYSAIAERLKKQQGTLLLGDDDTGSKLDALLSYQAGFSEYACEYILNH